MFMRLNDVSPDGEYYGPILLNTAKIQLIASEPMQGRKEGVMTCIVIDCGVKVFLAESVERIEKLLARTGTVLGSVNCLGYETHSDK